MRCEGTTTFEDGAWNRKRRPSGTYLEMAKIQYIFPFFQEMVNLITTGKATSNAFDNTIELDSGGANVVSTQQQYLSFQHVFYLSQ